MLVKIPSILFPSVGFPKIRGTFLGVPIIGFQAFRILWPYWGAPSFGNHPVLSAPVEDLDGSIGVLTSLPVLRLLLAPVMPTCAETYEHNSICFLYAKPSWLAIVTVIATAMECLFYSLVPQFFFFIY